MQDKIRSSVRSVIRHNNNAVTLVLENAKPFVYLPGQFINLTIEMDGSYHSRSYSLSSISDEDESPSITVKRVSGGKLSNHIVDHAEELKEVIIEGPFGGFTVENIKDKYADVVLIAGGSGISPIISILKYLLKYSSSRILLICCNRSEEEIIFHHLINNLSAQYADRLIVQHFLSSSQSGRLSRLTLKKRIKQFSSDPAQAYYFICGPEGLINMADETIQALPAANVFFEKFTTVADSPLIQTQTAEVLFNTYGSIRLIEVGPNTDLLQAALNERIPVRYSCRSGNCGVCIAKKEGGAVYMRQNFTLDESQLADDYILLCQSYPMDNAVSVLIP